MRNNQLYINVSGYWHEIDLFEDTTIPITLKVTEVKNFASRKTGYSTEFNIPHTNNNAKTFGLVSDINIYRGTFEVGKDYPAYITNGGITTFEGQFRLKRVIKRNSGSYIYYVGNMFGGTKNFVDVLGNKTLTGNEDPADDLDFSEYDTQGTDMKLNDFVRRLQSRLLNGTGWGLTLLDKTNKASQAFSDGSQTWYTDECTPYLHAREIFEKLFEGSGYTYVSEFLQGTDFSSYLQDDRWKNTIGKYDVNSLIYPYMRHNSTILSPNPVSTELFQVTSNANSELFKTSVPPFDQHSFSEWAAMNGANNNYTVNFDSNDYNITSNGVNIPLTAWRFVCPTSGTYDIKVKLPFWVKTQFYRASQGSILVGQQNTDNDPDQKFTYWVSLMKNNRELVQLAQTQNYPEHYEIDENGWTTLVPQQELSYSGNVSLAAGDVIQIYCAIQMDLYYDRWDSTTEQWGRTWAFWSQRSGALFSILRPTNITFESLYNDQTNSIITITQNEGFYEEAAFTPNSILNQKTKKIDFFNNFVKMFNLYVEDVSGKKNYKTGGIYPPNTLRIEPYEIFYSPELGTGQSNIKDWTDKLDWGTVEYRRCEDYLYNIQNFTKVQDGDFYNANYNSTYKLPYGNREVVGEYCTKDDKNNIELKVSSNLCGVVNNATDTLQCPKVFSLNNTGKIDPKKEYTEGIFFIWRNYMNGNTDTGINYTMKLQSRLSSRYQNVSDYFCADTLNKGYGTADANLNWGDTRVYYQNMKGTIPTYNNLFNAFYAKEYAEKTSQDAIILKAKIYLNNLDINTVQMSDSIIIDGDHYHILEITQWEEENKPCEIELIKTIPNFKVSRWVPVTGGDVPANILPVVISEAGINQEADVWR